MFGVFGEVGFFHWIWTSKQGVQYFVMGCRFYSSLVYLVEMEGEIGLFMAFFGALLISRKSHSPFICTIFFFSLSNIFLLL